MTRKALVLLLFVCAVAAPLFAVSPKKSSTRKPYFATGRVSRLDHGAHGYRVWVSGVRRPFLIPESTFRMAPIRVGVDVRLGGYYNRRGYYDYVEGYYGDEGTGNYFDRADGGLRFKRGTIRGTIERVDYDRGRFVVRSAISDGLITANIASDDLGELRVGDSVEVAGEWTKNGSFDAMHLRKD